MDLDTTADVHEEHTADLEPATADIAPADVLRPTLASTPAKVPIEPVAPIEPLPAERPIVARESHPPAADAEQSIVARESPVSRREPFISEPTVAAASAPPKTPTTVDVPTLRQPVTDSAAAIAPARKPILKAVTKPAQRPAMGPGTVLCDRYLLEQVIGCGGTAIVFRARDMLSAKGSAPNIQVAVKTPRPELGDPARATKRLKHEFEHARLLSHPSIVRVLDFHEDQDRCFMTMELVEGKLLSRMLRDWTMLPVPLAYRILHQCADALGYAHCQNVVHGDFKPGNVFITRDEGVRIVDFGTAAGPSTSESRIPAGTPTYASPEVLSGQTPDARDDVFSFACVAYEVLTGQHPFGRLSSLQARDEAKIPPRAWNLSTSQWLSLLSALSWKREQRPASVQELFSRLSSDPPVATAAPVHVDPEEVVPAELPAELMPKQRSWGFFAFIACALLVTYFAFQSRKGPDSGGNPAPAITPGAATLPSGPLPTAPALKQEAPAAAAPETATDVAAPETEAPARATPAAATKATRPAAAMSEISFESPTIVTSETSVSAVFLIKRSQPLRDRVSVSWRAVSGTADAGIDFASSASGTVTFADGQAQRAIYVPLRNDLLKEPDETFYVELLPPKSSRLGKNSRAEAIIRDDD
jgi:serine/threonine protein kinase